MTSIPAIVWGRGAAIAPLAVSLIEAGISLREIWYQDALTALPQTVEQELRHFAAAVPLIGAVNTSMLVCERLKRLPEVKVVAEVFYTKVIGTKVLERVNVINIHPAPLPRYRGAHPLPWQIMRGETQSAVSFHLADRDIDAGPLLHQVPFAIDAADDYGVVLKKVYDIIRAHSGSVFRDFARGELVPQPQDHNQATYVVQRAPDDGWIDWNAPAQDVRNRVRALTAPLPGAWSLWKGRKIIFDAVEVDESFSRYVGRTPGQMAQLNGINAILTADSAVIPRRVRDAVSGSDMTGELRVNDRFTKP